MSIDNEKWKVWNQIYTNSQQSTEKAPNTSIEPDSKQADINSEKKQAMAALQNISNEFSKDELQLNAGTPVS